MALGQGTSGACPSDPDPGCVWHGCVTDGSSLLACRELVLDETLGLLRALALTRLLDILELRGLERCWRRSCKCCFAVVCLCAQRCRRGRRGLGIPPGMSLRIPALRVHCVELRQVEEAKTRGVRTARAGAPKSRSAPRPIRLGAAGCSCSKCAWRAWTCRTNSPRTAQQLGPCSLLLCCLVLWLLCLLCPCHRLC